MSLGVVLALWIFAPAPGLIFLLGWTVWFVVTHLRGRAALVAWLVCAGLAGFVIWAGYALQAVDDGAVPTCGSGEGMIFGPSWSGGGQASHGSIVAAAVIGGVLWIAGGAATWGLRGRLSPLLAAFVALYLVLLVGLWYVSPHIWGPRHC